MTDLISRAAAIDEMMQMVKAHEHEIFRGELLHYTGIKAMLECLPTIDAIPVEWLECKRKEALKEGMRPDEVEAVEMVMWMWQKEQEAR